MTASVNMYQTFGEQVLHNSKVLGGRARRTKEGRKCSRSGKREGGKREGGKREGGSRIFKVPGSGRNRRKKITEHCKIFCIKGKEEGVNKNSRLNQNLTL